MNSHFRWLGSEIGGVVELFGWELLELTPLPFEYVLHDALDQKHHEQAHNGLDHSWYDVQSLRVDSLAD